MNKKTKETASAQYQKPELRIVTIDRNEALLAGTEIIVDTENDYDGDFD